MRRREFLLASAAGLLSSPCSADARKDTAGPDVVRTDVDLQRELGALPHYWENSVGSDRLVVGLREQWLLDLHAVRELCGFRSVRCHGLFNDEMGICPAVNESGPVTSFVYLDQVYDRLLETGVKPFVELSFMPKALASSRNAVFWYRGNTSPPRNMAHWKQLIDAFARHVIKRYGIAELAQWRFECWNEPNLSFWAGSQAQYFEFYEHTAHTLKSVDSRLQVGGPATSSVMWIPQFLEYCRRRRVPVDFVSTHIYADDPQENIFGKPDLYPFEEVIPRAVAQAQDQIRASAFTLAPLVISEWASQNPAFILQTLRDCMGLAETMSYWTFSAVFEEQGPPTAFFNDIYGLIGQSGIPRPSLHAFAALHRLGTRRLESTAGPVLASKADDGSCAILAWNCIRRTVRETAGDPLATYSTQGLSAGKIKKLLLTLKNRNARVARITTIDPAKASALPAYEAMGRPEYPTREQIQTLKLSAAMPSAAEVVIHDSTLTLELPPNAIALIEVPVR